MEIILDPRSIQWMLLGGGVMLVTGLIVWLASIGFFDNAKVVAASLGAGTLLLLCSGWFVIRKTSHQLAGKALSLLACLVMPLNLWFYHSHQLMTLDGNLWIAAAVCCALYAASAMVVRDRLFVYVLIAGLAGTGMLILADLHRFAEIAAPAAMLAAMGLAAIHAERLFPNTSGPFSRQSFGAAFFRSGHVLLAGGLMLVLGAQITGWFILPAGLLLPITAPEITTIPALKLLAIGIVLAGFYGYVFSGLISSQSRKYTTPALATLIWAELLGLQMLNLTYRSETILAVAALTGLALVASGRFFNWFRTAGRLGSGLMLLSFMGSTMLILGRVMSSRTEWVCMWLAVAMAGINFAAMLVAGPTGWRRGYTLMGVANVGLAMLVAVVLGHMSIWQKSEIACVIIGLAALVSGHLGWYREQEARSEGVSFRLFTGAILAGLPLLIAAIYHRFTGGLSLVDEMALLTVSSLMLMTGLMLQLRSTTLVGGSLLSLHVAMMLGFAGWEAQLALGVYLFIGGSAIFLTGLGLAVYRERIMTIPDRIHRREGVFKVLAWR